MRSSLAIQNSLARFERCSPLRTEGDLAKPRRLRRLTTDRDFESDLPVLNSDISPSLIGAYEVVRPIGEGANGVVYEARHARTRERVALKTVRGATAATLSSIRREILAISKLDHPGIARIVDHGSEQGLPWYAMELLDGRTLRDEIAHRFAQDSRTEAWRETPSLRRVIDVFCALCVPLAYLHSQGVIHRDLKPENVFIRDDGSVVLVDFGVAVKFGDSREYEIPDDAALSGTPSYMAPELILGRGIDARLDLYAVGCMLFECLTGRPPFDGASTSELLTRHVSTRPPAPSSLVAGVMPELEKIVLRLLEKLPTRRLGYAADLAQLLLGLGATAPGATSATPAYVYRPEFVGRSAEMRHFTSLWRGASESGRRFIVLGESGLGKTRVLHELATLAGHHGFTCVVAQCGALTGGADGRPYSSSPLHAFRRFLQRIADTLRDRELDVTSQLRVLADYEPALALLPALKAELEPIHLEPGAAKQRVFAALIDLIFVYGEGRPVLVVVDDLQWADELTLGFLAQLKDELLAERGIYLVCTSRVDDSSTELSSLLSEIPFERVTLSRLGRGSVAEMVSGMLALGQVPANFVDLMFRESNGNPFFVAEYVRAAIEHGLLRRDLSSGWKMEQGASDGDLADSVPPPMSVRSLMEQRLFGLDENALQLARSASVLGREFDADLLQAAAPDFDPSAIAHLRQRAVVEETDNGYLRFSHDRLRELAYAGISREDRRNLHRRSALALEAKHGESPTLNAHLSALARHWSAAGEHERAAHSHVRAGDWARSVYANREAVTHYHAALTELGSPSELTGRDSLQRLRCVVLESSADLLTLIGRQDEARAALAAAFEAVAASAHVWRSRLLWKRARTLETEHRHAEALEIYDAAEAALGEEVSAQSDGAWWAQWVHLQVERVWVHYWLADVEAMQQRVERVRSHIEDHASFTQRARFFQALMHHNLRRENYALSPETVDLARASLAAAELAGDAAGLAYARFLVGFALLFNGAHEAAADELTRALSASVETGDLALQARVLTYLTMCHRLRGEVASTIEVATRGLKLAESLNMDDYAGAALANLGWAAWRETRRAEARTKTSAALERWQRLSAKYDYPFQWLARLHALDLALEESTGNECLALSKQLLAPLQHRLPGVINEALRAAAEPELEPERSRAHLKRAVNAARSLKYI